MMSSPLLHSLRCSLEALALLHLARERMAAPPMQALLVVPIPERLMFLAKLDGADDREIRALLRCAPEDVALTSERMMRASQLLTYALDDPYAFIEAGPIVYDGEVDLVDSATPFPLLDRLVPRDTDAQLMRVLYRHVPVALIGEAVPPQLATLTLQQRLALYLLLVQGMSYNPPKAEIEQVLGCSERFVRAAIKAAQRAVGGG